MSRNKKLFHLNPAIFQNIKNYILVVLTYYDGGDSDKSTLVPPTHPDNETCVAYIEGVNINLCKGPGAEYGVIRQLVKGKSYQILGQADGWLNFSGNQWEYYDPSYIRYDKGESNSSSVLIRK
ncbi:hypothetical protein COD78_28390 [Bacillus cereus]|uniref:hypothetical protein n=1 Tax=Bacillus cereus TaxID=1396 RepID=UPI000BF30B02|nr:hypothetical protein CN454_28795 [Bacillus cereus]PGV18312.1 hypothetical protein COD78_28390 [Bacillus cereus]